MAEIATKSPQITPDKAHAKVAQRGATLGDNSIWLALANQEKKEPPTGQQQTPPPQKTLAELAKEREAQAAKAQTETPQTKPAAEYKAGEARTVVANASKQAVDTLNAMEELGKADRNDRDRFKKAVGIFAGMVGGTRLVEKILGEGFKPDSILASVIGKVDDPKELLNMYRAALPGGRKFNADHVRTVLAETNLMLQSASDLIKGLPADQASPATNTVGALAQRFLNVTDKLAGALRDKKPFANKDFAEMLSITAELRENGMAPKESQINSKTMKDMNGLVNAKGEPSKELKELLGSGKLTIEARDKITSLIDQVKALDPKKDEANRTTALLKLYAEVLKNTPDK